MIYFSKDHGFLHSSVHNIIPKDAVGITDQEHERLIQGQSDGKMIAADNNGRPQLVDQAANPEPATFPAVRNLRNAQLQNSDWTQLPDVPPKTREKWAKHRQLLRDVTKSVTDPAEAMENLQSLVARAPV